MLFVKNLGGGGFSPLSPPVNYTLEYYVSYMRYKYNLSYKSSTRNLFHSVLYQSMFVIGIHFYCQGPPVTLSHMIIHFSLIPSNSGIICLSESVFKCFFFVFFQTWLKSIYHSFINYIIFKMFYIGFILPRIAS